MKRTLRAAFTLIELLVAVGVSSILVTASISMYNLLRTSMGQDQLRADLAQNARVAVDRLSRELRQAPEIVTPLPASAADTSVPQPNAIEFEDGHANDLTYRRYFLNGTTLQLQVKEYYFASSPATRVRWNAVAGNGSAPSSAILSTQDIAENVTALRFYDGDTGTKLTVETVTGDGATQTYRLRSTVLIRN